MKKYIVTFEPYGFEGGGTYNFEAENKNEAMKILMEGPGMTDEEFAEEIDWEELPIDFEQLIKNYNCCSGDGAPYYTMIEVDLETGDCNTIVGGGE